MFGCDIFSSLQKSEDMAFCVPPKPNCGFLEHGCALYGGIQIQADANRRMKATDFYIPQFNLAIYWQRPFLVPHSIGFPHVLVRPSDWPSTRIPHRPPGHWNFDTPKIALKNRNLLTGLVDEFSGGDIVRLWAVNELSDRKKLMEFRIAKKECEDGFVDWEVVGGDGQERREVEDESQSEVCGSGTYKMTAQRKSSRRQKCDATSTCDENRRMSSSLSESLSERLLSTAPMESRMASLDDPGPVNCMDLPSSALQLHAWQTCRNDVNVLIRTENSLCRWNANDNDLSKLYASRVQYATPMPYMDEELLILDQERLIWFGDINDAPGKLTRVKCVGDIELICPSDHPRIIYVADAGNVWMVDLRDGTSHVAEFDDTSDCGRYYTYEDAFPLPIVQHICPLNGRPRMMLVTTSNKFCLMDERMPQVRYIEQAHSIADGGDYILSAPRFSDCERNGYVYPFYIIRNITLADVQQVSFYEHAQQRHWSSLCHVKRLAEPSDIAVFLDEQRKYGVRVSRGQRRRLFGDGPTRAIHVQDGLGCGCDRREKHILFRMLSDGSIWYEETSIGDDRDDEERMLNRSVEKVRRMVQESETARGPFWEENVDSALLRQPESLTRHWNIEGPMGSAGMNEESFGDIGEQVDDPMRTTIISDYPNSEPQRQFDGADHIISDIVLKCWSKYS